MQVWKTTHLYQISRGGRANWVWGKDNSRGGMELNSKNIWGKLFNSWEMEQGFLSTLKV